jgi:hypothetical protein
MDEALRRTMLRYYDERAPEYDEAYTCGTGTTSIPNPSVFINDAVAISTIVARMRRGDFSSSAGMVVT